MTEPRDTPLPELITRIEGWCERAIGRAIFMPVLKEVRRRAERGESVRANRMRHLEGRILAQRRTITALQARLRERNVARAEWYRGRDMMLREMLRDVTGSMYAWKMQAEEAQRQLRKLREEKS